MIFNNTADIFKFHHNLLSFTRSTLVRTVISVLGTFAPGATEKNVPSNNLISQHRAEEIHLSVAPKSQRASVDHELQIFQFDRARHKALDQTHQSAHHELASVQQLAVAC